MKGLETAPVKAKLAKYYREAWAIYGAAGKATVKGDEKMGRLIRAVLISGRSTIESE